MNIKKLFAILAGVSMVANVTLPGLALAATPDTELGKAYEWAYSKGITTMDSYEKANMTANITRAEMAKMLSVYAKNFLGKKADTSKACTFSDIDSVKGDLHDYIIESCQLGIMGQGITEFRPYDSIPRSEFGTALSRALWGDEYNGGTPFYAKHLVALQSAGIMTQIDNAENRKEVRGYVMIMLQRAEEGGASVDCSESTIALACLDPELDAYKDCPAACRADNSKDSEKDSDEVVKAGDLDVTVAGESNGRVFIGRSSDLDTITLKTSEEVTISRIILERIGYSSASNISNVRLENDKGTIIADAKTPDSKGQVKLSLKKDYKVVDGELDAIIVVETKGGNDANALTAGSTVGFKVVDVESTAKNLNISGKANTYSAVKYDGSVLTFSNFKDTATKDYNWEADETYEVAKFKVKAPDDSSIILRGFTFKNDATTANNDSKLDLRKYFDSAEVTIAGEKVKGLDASVNKDDELVITFNDIEVAAKAKSEVIVKISLVDDFDQFTIADRVQLILKDFVAVDGKVESRVSATKAVADANTNPVTYHDYYGKSGLYVFKGGKVKLTNTKLGNVDAALESEGIEIAEGNISVNEAVKGTFKITASGDGAGAIKQMTIVVNGEETDASKNGDVYTFTNVEIEKSGKVKFLIDTVDATEANNNAYKTKTINFTTFNSEVFSTNGGSLVYDESNKSAANEVSGSISFSKVTIQSAKASMTNSMTKEVEFANKESNQKVVFDGTYTAKKGEVKLNAFTITSKATGNDLTKLINYVNNNKDKITFYVTIDGEEVADGKIACVNNVCSISDTFNDVVVEAGESVKVVVEAEVEANNDLNNTRDKFADNSTAIDLGKFQVVVSGEDTNGNAAGEGSAATVSLKVVIKGSVTISAGAVKETVLYKTSNAEIAAFTVKPANNASETDLEEIKFTLMNTTTSQPIVAAGANPDGYITVKADNVEADDCTAGANGLITCSFNEKVGSEGVKVSVSLDDETTGVVKLTGLNINGKPQTREFKKRFESAVVSIESMKDLGGTTQFTVNVEKDSDISVRNLSLYFDKGVTVGGTTTNNPATLTKVFDDGDTLEADGTKDEVRLVNQITYYVSDTTICQTPTTIESVDYCLVTITKDATGANADNYADFFKVGDQYARAYKSNS